KKSGIGIALSVGNNVGTGIVIGYKIPVTISQAISSRVFKQSHLEIPRAPGKRNVGKVPVSIYGFPSFFLYLAGATGYHYKSRDQNKNYFFHVSDFKLRIIKIQC